MNIARLRRQAEAANPSDAYTFERSSLLLLLDVIETAERLSQSMHDILETDRIDWVAKARKELDVAIDWVAKAHKELDVALDALEASP